jgi:hypothetical protein
MNLKQFKTKQMKKDAISVIITISAIILILLLAGKAQAQTTQQKPERTFAYPFNESYLYGLNLEAHRADSALIKGDPTRSIYLLRALIDNFNKLAQQQSQQAQPADTTKRGKKPKTN